MAFQQNAGGNIFGGQPTNAIPLGKSVRYLLLIVKLTSRGQLTLRVQMRSAVLQRPTQPVVYLKHPRLVAGCLEAMHQQP